MYDTTSYLPPGELLFDAAAVQDAVFRQAAELRPQLERENPVVLVLMQGALYYAAWLTLALAIPLELDYAHASRYGDRRKGGELVWQRCPGANLAGRSVLVVDDIFDEGKTLAAVREACTQAGARELRTAVLARKLHDRVRGPLPESAALEVPDRFIVGCGLDYCGRWRNLPALYALTDEAVA
ncbi:MAG: hypoxanthine-guanine phosphoribosyltransferase [Gammaproteobacteria bacterium]